MCPKCREILSPNDTLEMTYEVLDSTSSKDGVLAEAFLRCNKCGSIIRLHGFAVLKEAESFNLLLQLEMARLEENVLMSQSFE
jgi:RNase P subunit RPR2